MARILVLAGVNGAGKSSLLGAMLQADGASWFNPDSFTRELVDAGWPLAEANAEAWHEGKRRLERAMAEDTDYAFETTLGAEHDSRPAPPGLRAARGYGLVLRFEQRGAALATRRRAGGWRRARYSRRQEYDASGANLIELMPYLNAVHVYDNSVPADAEGRVCPLLVLEMDQAGVGYPITVQEFSLVPAWAEAIVMGAMEARRSNRTRARI